MFKLKQLITATMAFGLFSASAVADQIFNDDLIVVGSICSGTDCVNGENFGFDTLRLKENNLRIRFQDTSSSGSFPTIDWQITANDSANGGTNHFAIEELDGGTVPFFITSGARNHSLFVSSASRIGIKTSAPAVQMHMVDGNSPTLRLEQDGSSGFTSQAWDVAGNETNFFIRDASNGGKLPFRIVPGATNNSLYIAADGDIGFETQTPDGILDIAHPTDANNHALLIAPSADVGINIDNGQLPAGLFDIQSTGGVSEFTVLSNGNTTINGTSTLNGEVTVTGGLSLNSNVYVDSTGKVGVNSNVFTNVYGLIPSFKIQAPSGNHAMLQFNNSDANYTSGLMFNQGEGDANMKWFFSSRNNFNSGADAFYVFTSSADTPVFSMFQDKTIGIGGITAAESGKGIITTFGGAYLSTGGTWMNASSRDLKQDIETLSAAQAVAALEKLEPVTYSYIANPGDPHAGFIAEDVPEIVAAPDRKSLSSLDIVAVLTKVVKEQQATIKAQQQIVEQLTKRVERVEDNH